MDCDSAEMLPRGVPPPSIGGVGFGPSPVGLHWHAVWRHDAICVRCTCACRGVHRAGSSCTLTPQQTELVTCRVTKWAFLRVKSAITRTCLPTASRQRCWQWYSNRCPLPLRQTTTRFSRTPLAYSPVDAVRVSTMVFWPSVTEVKLAQTTGW